MKIFKTLLLIVLFSISGVGLAQETPVKRILPADPETNCQIRYYYYPNLEAYFDKAEELYIFRDKGEWKREKEIPSGYRGYGLYNKVSIAITDFDDDDITPFFNAHKKKYPYGSLKRARATVSNH
ncbi:hypothetical protein [Flavobacterium sp.]|uniref:hypothetical protein n=1 Tax=Flavobacterium sp. TaxID=239 RepID=UPI0011FAB9F5|nr:hypothetical protein [Flavobacterium sp.]RZJ71045.1 MAG: hypothetical protein EOO49_11360 [Flavobacterium sp.]